MFLIIREPIDAAPLLARCRTSASGALATFEGTVRNHNAGQAVSGLDYDCYEPLALAEGARILDEARHRFDIHEAVCVHRVGSLAIGDAAVFIGVSAAHRGGAFAACQFIIDEVKARVPIWKRERYPAGTTQWLDSAPKPGEVA
jgi:molybdopterin synthase catalytic subunit